jgi:hypothetical protein
MMVANCNARLERPWIYQEPPPPISDESEENGDVSASAGGNGNRGESSGVLTHRSTAESASSSLSLGDTHIWRENDGSNA